MEISDLLQKIIKKAYEINVNTKKDVFIDFQGHVNAISVSYCENGWDNDEEVNYLPTGNTEFECIYLDEKNSAQKLAEILKKLERLEN